MIFSVRQAVLAFRDEHPLAFVLLASLGTLLLLFLAALETFKPTGKRRSKSGKQPILPPGPRGLPLFGNLHSLKEAREDPEQKFVSLPPSYPKPTAANTPQLKSLGQYGEMATLHLGSKTWILLNSKRVVAELIARRGSATNTRSPMPISSGIVSHGHRRSLLMTQEKWAEPRRVMHSLLSGTALRQYGAWQEMESAQMLAEYVLWPSTWYRHHYRYANSVIHRIALGERLTKSTRELVDMQNCVTYFVGSIGSSVVDWFPSLARLPRVLQPWRRHWDALDRWNFDVYTAWYAPARDKVRAGTAPPSFIRDSLLHPDTKYTGSDLDAMYVAMQLIEAGSDTTREALNIMVMAALEHPDAFRRARAEVDKVCGMGADARLPVLQDMESLRYICAMAKEVLRWRPIFVVTPDHVASQDIDFERYHFPEGTGFVINEVMVGRECEDPDTFDPDRWMDGHETDITHGLWQFGGGRRVCVGYRLAQRSLFINIARLAQCFDYKAVSAS